MIEGLKTVLFYVTGLAGLVLITLFFTGQNYLDQPDLLAGDLSPAATGPPVSANPSKVTGSSCTITPQLTALPQQTTVDKIPSALLPANLIPADLQQRHKIRADIVDNANCYAQRWPQNCEFEVAQPAVLAISGTVYASDCHTPLPDALITVWYANPEGQYSYAEPNSFWDQLRTDAAGRYKVATLKPGRKLGMYDSGHELHEPHLHIRIRYQDNEPFVTRLVVAEDTFTTSPSRQSASTKPTTEPLNLPEPVMQATFNIVLPVP